MFEAVVGVERTHSSDSYQVASIITITLMLFISLSPDCFFFVFVFFRLGQPEFEGPHPSQHLAPLSWSQPALAAHLRPALHPRLWDRRGHRLWWVRSTHPANPLSDLDCASCISVWCMLWKVCIGVLWHLSSYDRDIELFCRVSASDATSDETSLLI